MTFRRTALLVLLLCSAAADVFAQNADVNAERVSMDMQMLRAIRGTAALGSMAVWPQPVAYLEADSTDDFSAWVTSYYRPMLTYGDSTARVRAFESDDRFRLLAYGDENVTMMGDGYAMMRPGYSDDGDSSGAFAIGALALRFAGSFDFGVAYMLSLSNGVRFTGDPAQISRTDPTLGRTFKFNAEEKDFFDQYTGYVQYQREYLRVRFGRDHLQYGFSPIDNFVHSINAAPMDGLVIDVPYKGFRFTMTHSAASGTDTAGTSVPEKYIATHRIAIDPLPWLSVAVSDMIVYWGRGVDFAYLNPLAFYVSAGLQDASKSQTDNSILGLDLAVRPWSGAMLYGAFIADDLSYSSLSDTSANGNNNKFAFQVGATQIFDVGSQIAIVTLEYARINPFTFSHRTLNPSYTHQNAPVGYNMQSNSDRIALQGRWWFTPRTNVRIDLDYTRRGENILDSAGNILMGQHPTEPTWIVPIGNVGGDILRGDGDFIQGNRFLRGNLSTTRRVSLWFTAEWMPNVFTDLRAGYQNTSGGNAPGSFGFGSLELRLGF